MVGVRVNRIELDEVWSFVGKEQKRVQRHETFGKGDQCTYIALAGTRKAAPPASFDSFRPSHEHEIGRGRLLQFSCSVPKGTGATGALG
jgi:hypothetical protein